MAFLLKKEKFIMAIASLILGIASIVFSQSFGLVPAILAIVFAKKAEAAGQDNGMSKAGKICGIVGLILSIISIILIIGYLVLVVGGSVLMVIAEGL